MSSLTANARISPSAPQLKNRNRKGEVLPQTAGVFDVKARGGSYNINTPLMGIGTPEPLARLHVGAGVRKCRRPQGLPYLLKTARRVRW